MRTNLIFKGTRDGFGYDDFSNRVKGKGNLIGLVKSEHDKVFGWYVSIPDTRDDEYHADEKAFIFSLTNRSKHDD